MGTWYSSIEYMYKYTYNAKVTVDFCVDIERKPRALQMLEISIFCVMPKKP